MSQLGGADRGCSTRRAAGPATSACSPRRRARRSAPSCAAAGIVGALPGVMGSMMALEAIKLIARRRHPARGALLIYDGLHAETRRLRVAARPAARSAVERPVS